MLLDSGPVVGKTLLMSQIFLICKEVSPEMNIPFFPYQLGPYSNEVAREFNQLIKESFIDMQPLGNTFIFSITAKGKAELKSQPLLMHYDTAMLEVKRSQIERINKTTQELGLAKTTEFLKSQYAVYFTRARI